MATAQNGRQDYVVRVAKGKFAPEHGDAVAGLLAEGEAELRDAIQGLDGLVRFYAGIDRERGYVTNISVWTTLEAAHQMDSLQPMLDQRPRLQQAGVEFEAATNDDTVWSIAP